MKILNKYLLLTICIFFCLISCDNDDSKPKPTPEPIPTPPAPVSEFAGYMFVLDQAQIPDLGGYEAEKDVPQAKLMAIDPNGKLHLDILAEKNIDVQLGFECTLERVDGHFVIFAKKVSLKDPYAKTQVTVINDETLEVVSQTTYEFNSGYPGDFRCAATAEKAYIANRGVINTLDLKTGTVNQFAEVAYSGAASYKGSLFVAMKDEAVIKVFTLNNTEGENIKTPKKVSRIYPLCDTILFAKSEGDECYLVSMESKKVMKTINMNLSGLQRYSMVYDTKANRIYVAGQGRGKKNKVYYLDLKQETPTVTEMYTVPETDINLNHPISGNIKLGLNPEKNILYIGHLDNLVFADKVPPGIGKRATRSAYISSISLDGIDARLPINTPETKNKIEDMYEFSRFFFYGN